MSQATCTWDNTTASRKRTKTKRYNEESWQAGRHMPNTGISSKATLPSAWRDRCTTPVCCQLWHMVQRRLFIVHIPVRIDVFACRKKSWTCCTMCFVWRCLAGVLTSLQLSSVQVGVWGGVANGRVIVHPGFIQIYPQIFINLNALFKYPRMFLNWWQYSWKHTFYTTIHFTQVVATPTADGFIIFCTCELFYYYYCHYFTNFAFGKNATNNILIILFGHNHKMSIVDTLPHFLCRPSWLF